jgi:hypothetical protein
MMAFHRWFAQAALVFFVGWVALVPDGPQVDYRAWVLGGVGVVGLVVWLGQRPLIGDWQRLGLSYGPLLLLLAALVGSWRSRDPAAAWEWAMRVIVPAVVVYGTAIIIGRYDPSIRRRLLWARPRLHGRG